MDPDALALLLVVQYRARNLEGFLATLKGAEARHVPAAGLLQNRRYKAMLTQDHETGRLSAELKARLLKGEYGACAIGAPDRIPSLWSDIQITPTADAQFDTCASPG